MIDYIVSFLVELVNILIVHEMKFLKRLCDSIFSLNFVKKDMFRKREKNYKKALKTLGFQGFGAANRI